MFNITNPQDQTAHDHAVQYCQSHLEQATCERDRQYWSRILEIVQDPRAIARHGIRSDLHEPHVWSPDSGTRQVPRNTPSMSEGGDF